MRSPQRILPPADESVVIPSSVRAQMARAAAAQEASIAVPPVEGEAPIETTGNPPPAPTPPATTAVEPVAPPVATPVAPVSPAPVTPPAQDDDSFERKYNSLKGRYDRLQADNSTLTARVDEMQRVMATMTVVPPVTPSPTRSKDKLITPKDEGEYGAEFLDVVRRAAREVVNDELENVDQRLDQFGRQVQSVSQVTTISAQDRMFNRLDEAVPNWRVQNNDPNFLSWLALPDPFSGDIRGSMLRQAFGQNDANRVIAFFKGFLNEAAVDPQAPKPEPVTPEGNRPTLEELAAPGRARTAAPSTPTTPAEKPIISRAEIAKFYLDVSAGKYAGLDDERNDLEKQIFEAQRDGRIR